MDKFILWDYLEKDTNLLNYPEEKEILKSLIHKNLYLFIKKWMKDYLCGKISIFPQKEVMQTLLEKNGIHYREQNENLINLDPYIISFPMGLFKIKVISIDQIQEPIIPFQPNYYLERLYKILKEYEEGGLSLNKARQRLVVNERFEKLDKGEKFINLILNAKAIHTLFSTKKREEIRKEWAEHKAIMAQIHVIQDVERRNHLNKILKHLQEFRGSSLWKLLIKLEEYHIFTVHFENFFGTKLMKGVDSFSDFYFDVLDKTRQF